MAQGINLKLNIKGIRFKTWTYLLVLTMGILGLLWILQITFLKPYYRNTKIKDIRYVASMIEQGIQQDRFSDSIVSVAVRNNVCATVFNAQQDLVYYVDTLGVNCFLSRFRGGGDAEILSQYINEAKKAGTSDFYFTLQNLNFRQEMIFYGKEVQVNLANYYVFVNAPIEPLDSTIAILQDQFIYVTIVVFLLSGFFTIIISSRIAKPLAKMTESARKLAAGNIDVTFEPEGYSEVKELAQTLNFATNEISKMDELRKDLIANVSHDIKTPLTMIKAYAEMIKELSGDDPIKREKHLDIILHEAAHLDRLVNDMLQLSQYQANSLSVSPAPMHLKSLIDHIVTLFSGFSENGSVAFDVQVDETFVVIADEVKIGQVLYNFVNNAIAHVGEDKLIIISAVRKKENIRVSVIDHGHGISPTDLPYIWDRYYKSNRNFTRSTQSTGLGLAIAKSICIAHSINFGVFSNETEGSCFFVDLPVDTQF